MIKPIKPSEVKQEIPDWVIQGANECITENYREIDGESHFTQDELIEHVLKHVPCEHDDTLMGVRAKLFKNNWLDIEPIYRKEGWIVEYDRPAYNESYPANFTFKVPR